MKSQIVKMPEARDLRALKRLELAPYIYSREARQSIPEKEYERLKRLRVSKIKRQFNINEGVVV